MRIRTNQLVISIFILIVYCQLCLPSFRVNMVIQSIALIGILLITKRRLTILIINKATPLVLIFSIGLIIAFFHPFRLINFIKDTSHFLKPILGLLLGYTIFRYTELKLFVKIIIFAGFVSALIHSIQVFIFSSHNLESINSVRNFFGKDNFLELFSLLFILFYSKFQHEVLFQRKLFKNIILILLIFSNVLYFSRTMVVVFAISILSIYGYTKLNAKMVRLFLLALVLIISFYSYLFSIKLDRNGKGVESFLYKVKIAPSEIFVTKIDKENHKDLWDHWRGYEVKRAIELMNKNKLSYLFGTGFGSLIDLKFKAPLGSEKMRYISEIHNGYIYIFYKTGLIGLMFLLFFLKKLHSHVYLEYTFENQFIALIGVAFFFTTLTITGIYNSLDIIILILGGLIATSNNNSSFKSNRNESKAKNPY